MTTQDIRTLTSHTYNEETAEKIASDTANIYFQEFVALYAKLDSLKGETE